MIAYRPPRIERVTDFDEDCKQEAFMRLLQTDKGRALLERVLYNPDPISVGYFVRAYKAVRVDMIRYANRKKRAATDTEPIFERDFMDHASSDGFKEVEAADELSYILRQLDCPELQRFLHAYATKEKGQRVPQSLLNQLVKDRRTSGLKLQLT